jgi:transcriptional regulator with XRE-family HTH domain
LLIGQWLRELRDSKKLGQGDIEERTGLLGCHISRVENGHTIPSVESLEKMARALEIPIHLLFHDGKTPVKKMKLSASTDAALWGADPNERRELRLFAKALARMTKHQRDLLLHSPLVREERLGPRQAGCEPSQAATRLQSSPPLHH